VTVSSSTPVAGIECNDALVTITGSGFTSANTLTATFADLPVTVTSQTDTQVTITIPSGPSGTGDIALRSPVFGYVIIPDGFTRTIGTMSGVLLHALGAHHSL
jgi:hypothetical protein